MISMLEFRRAGETRFRVRLSRSLTRVGRGERSDVTLPEEHVSRTHFVVQRSGGRFELVDRSRNGTVLNGVAVERAQLSAGDTIALPPWEILFRVAEDHDPPVTVVRDLVSPVPVVSASGGAADLRVEAGELRARQGAATGERYVIRKAEVRVGSDPACDWVLPGDVAPYHFTVRMDRGRFLVRDSGGGIRVDGASADGWIPLAPGGQVEAGEAVFELQTRTHADRARPVDTGQLGEMVGRSPAMRALFGLIRRVAQSDVSALVLGESGTGKELVAQALHDQGPRARKSFVAVNCGAIPRDLVESELFGHRKGAFTGAIADRAGAFRAAHGGTLFLDEIGDLALDDQVRLLRALETHRVRPVGADREVAVDVRVVAATHRNLAREVAEGRFREDLYFRLAVVPLTVPALRERRDDIPLLVQHFLSTVVEGRVEVGPAAMDKLVQHAWRGNVRALRNCLLRAALLADGPRIDPRHVTFDAVRAPDPLLGLDADAVTGLLEHAERAAIEHALTENDGNKQAAARMLGVAKSTLYSLMKKYGMD